MSSKLREVLSKAGIALSWATHGHLTEDDAEKYLAIVDAALSKPVLNCEVGTPEEQSDRFRKYCQWEQCNFWTSLKGEACAFCPLKGIGKESAPCIIHWLQMPYEKGVTNE